MRNLEPNTTYYVRAYVCDSYWLTYYGEVKQFTTKQVELPQVSTGQELTITSTSAIWNGEVIDGMYVTERGFCWNYTGNPTIADEHARSGSGVGEYTVEMAGLLPETTYYAKAYAINGAGTSYGEEVSFATSKNWPDGILPGVFSVSYGKRIQFSQGNLQYQASTNTWRFAENQWDVVGANYGGVGYGNVYENGVKCDNRETSSTYSGWIDLFGWGTSGYHYNGDSYNVNYQPWSTSSSNLNNSYNKYGYGPSTNMTSTDLTGSSANYDWGVYNRISNGGNQSGRWRTLAGGYYSTEEWNYLFNIRATSSGIRYAKAQVNGINGVILLPDDWSPGIYDLHNHDYDAEYDSNIITQLIWNTVLEPSGAVFLPAAGRREGNNGNYILYDDYNRDGYYWTVTDSYEFSSSSLDEAYALYFSYRYLNTSSGTARKCYGLSVRLVRDVE
jgi:hypothetical protein